MKTPQEFRLEVYAKRDAAYAARKKARRRAALCGALAAVVLVCSALIPLYRSNGVSYHAPLSLQVGTPAKVEDWGRSTCEKNGGMDWDSDRAAMRQQALQDAALDKDFQGSLNGFARDVSPLLLKGSEENACWCPVSAYYAMALTAAGAQGQTEQEFLDLLGAKDISWLSDQCQRYYRQHYHENDACTFTLANSLWLDNRCEFEDDYLQTAQKDFYASMFQADFTDPRIGGEISQWVSDNTGGLLKPELEFAPETMLAILNTVYFKAAWFDEFYEESNAEGDFTRADGSTVTAEYMRRTSFQSVLKGEGFTRASLPLREDAEMIFILPEEGVSPQQLVNDPKAFEQMFFPVDESQTKNCQVEWSVPKFEMESKFDLKDTLATTLPSAFDPGKADFSRMSKKERLYVDQMEHGVHMAIDEDGAEAAAYTMVTEVATGAMMPEETVEMKLNRPFLFAIVSYDVTEQNPDSYNEKSILFVGVCGDPTK